MRVALVGMVTSIWRCGKKPKLVTSELKLSHVVAFRFVEMSKSDEENQWVCDGQSESVVLRPEALAAILDPESVQQLEEKCIVQFSYASMELVNQLDDFAKHWPQETGELRANLCLPGQGRKKRARGKGEKTSSKTAKGDQATDDIVQEAEGGGIAAETDAMVGSKTGKEKSPLSKKMKKDKKGKKQSKKEKKKKKETKEGEGTTEAAPRLKKAKAAKEKLEIEMKVENFKKTPAGKELIEQEMQKLKNYESARWPQNPLFCPKEGTCRIKAEQALGVPWKEILQHGFGFCKARYGRLHSGAWGQAVFDKFKSMMEALEKNDRKPFMHFLKDICECYKMKEKTGNDKSAAASG